MRYKQLRLWWAIKARGNNSLQEKLSFFRLSHDVVTCDVDRDVSAAYWYRLHASLLQAMRSTGHTWSYKTWCSAVISYFSTALIGAFRYLLFRSVICSLGGPLSHGSPVVVFFDRGHPRFWNFYSTIPVDVVRVKSYMNYFFDSARDPYHYTRETNEKT